jgi:hypothetical protein
MLSRRRRRRRRRSPTSFSSTSRRGSSTATQQLTNFCRTILLIPPNDIGLGQSLKSQFMNLNIGTKGDETDETVLGEEVEDLLDGVS